MTGSVVSGIRQISTKRRSMCMYTVSRRSGLLCVVLYRAKSTACFNLGLTELSIPPLNCLVSCIIFFVCCTFMADALFCNY